MEPTPDILAALNRLAEALERGNATAGTGTPVPGAPGANPAGGQYADASMLEQLNQQLSTLMDSSDGAAGAMGTFLQVIAGGTISVAAITAGIKGLSTSFPGLQDGLDIVSEGFSTILSSGLEVAQSLFNIGTAILSIPFRILSGIMEMRPSGGSSQLRQEIENVRKAFGELDRTAGADIMRTWKTFRGELAETGLSVYRIFGNRAERLKAIREAAEALGPVFENISDQFRSGGERILAYQKGLGLSNESLKAMASTSMATGVSMQEMGRRITSVTAGMSRQFGISAKVMSRDIGNMMKDMRTFGTLSVQELSQVSAFTRKLGIDFEAVVNVTNKFSDFEEASQNAARLAQAFGLQIDALEQVQEQDPARIFENIRQAFFRTGRDANTLKRQELDLLTATTGLTAEQVKLGFSLKNQGLSYDQVAKAGDEANKKQLTQEEAMKNLADAIERLVQSGSALRGGFFEVFMKGFTDGITRSGPFREMMLTLNRALRLVYWSGVEVGRMFVQFFPSVKEFFTGITQIFERSRLRSFLGDIKSALKEFFKLVRDPSEVRGAVSGLFERLKDAFTKWFGVSGEGIKQVGESAVRFFATLIRIGVAGAAEGLKGLLKSIKGFFTGSEASSTITEVGSSFFGTLLSEGENLLFGSGGIGEMVTEFLSYMVTEIPATLAAIFSEENVTKFTNMLGRWSTQLGNWVSGALDTILSIFNPSSSSAQEGSQGITQMVSDGLSKASEAVKSFFDNITSEENRQKVAQILSNLGTMVRPIFDSLRKGFETLFGSDLTKSTEGIKGTIKGVTSVAADGLIESLVKNAAAIGRALREIIYTAFSEGAVEAFRKVAPILPGAGLARSFLGAIGIGPTKQGSAAEPPPPQTTPTESVQQLTQLAASIPNEEQTKELAKNIEASAKLFEEQIRPRTSEFIVAANGILEIFSELDGGTATASGAAMQGIQLIFSSLVGISSVANDLKGGFEPIKNVAFQLKESAQQITYNFNKAISEFANLDNDNIEGTTGRFNGLVGLVSSLIQMNSTLSTIPADLLSNIRLAAWSLGGAEGKASIHDIVYNFNQAVETFGELNLGTTGTATAGISMISVFVDQVSKFANTLKSFNPATILGIQNGISMLREAFIGTGGSSVSAIFNQIGTALTVAALPNLAPIEGFLNSLDSITQRISRINSQVSGAGETKEGNFEQFTELLLTPSLEALNNMIATTKTVDRELAAFARTPITISTSLRNIADEITGAGRMEYQINSGQVQINVNVKVTLGVDELQQILSTKGETKLATVKG